MPFLMLSGSEGGGDDFPAVVMEVEGNVKYSPDADGSLKPLEAGIFLGPQSRLRLKRHARVVLFYNHFIRVDEKGKYDLAELLAGIDPDPQQRMDFRSVFYTYLIQAGVETAFKGFGDAFGGSGRRGPDSGFGGSGRRGPDSGFGGSGRRGPDSGFGGSGRRGPDSGWGTKQDNIVPIFPYEGLVTPARTDFSWSPFPDAGHYEFKLVDASAGQPIHQENTADTTISIDLEALGITPGANYQWTVTPARDPSKASTVAGFTGGTAAKAVENLDRVAELEDYRSGGPVTRLLMEAIALEADKWYYLAYEKYREGLKEHPDNLLLRRSYATFLYRQGLKPLAIKALE